MITLTDREDFAKLGFVIAKGIVDPETASVLLENVFRLFQRFADPNPGLSQTQKPWYSNRFHQELLALRQRSPKTFSAFYDSAQTSVVLAQLMTSPAIVERAADLLGVRASELSMQKPELRMDAPFDERNRAGWHQEQSYFGANRNGLRGITVWMPLIDVTSQLGPLDVCPGSHVEGFIGPGSTKWQSSPPPFAVETPAGPKGRPDPDYMVTEQLEVPQEVIDQYETVSVPMKVGDALLFNMLIFHRSGENTSDRFRFSSQLRLHTATADDFRPFVTVPKYNPYLEEILGQNPAVSKF